MFPKNTFLWGNAFYLSSEYFLFRVSSEKKMRRAKSEEQAGYSVVPRGPFFWVFNIAKVGH